MLPSPVPKKVAIAPPQSRYIFKHALIRDAAFQSVLNARRRELHERIAEILASRFPEVAETEPELLAHHYTEARQNSASKRPSLSHSSRRRSSENCEPPPRSPNFGPIKGDPLKLTTF
jgi:hypothetical protein